jgi:IrrE N-terminal-like domain
MQAGCPRARGSIRPVPGNPTPEGRAALLLHKHQVTAAPVPVERIATTEGLRIGRKRHNGPEFSFALNDDGDGHAVIGINTSTHENRQRGAVAHGLGHALMHMRPGRVIIVCRAVRRPDDDTIPSSPSREEEAAASAFSTALLMPDDLFIPAAVTAAEGLPAQQKAARDEIAEALARQFGVSVDAAAFRLVALGLLAV